MIGMWLGLLADIPAGWQEVSSMRGKHLKCSNTILEYLTGGGSNTHSHVNQNHDHQSIDHGHTYSSGMGHSGQLSASGSGARIESSSVIHAGATITNSTYSLSSSATSASSTSNEPSYRTVNFIKLVSIMTGGAFILNML